MNSASVVENPIIIYVSIFVMAIGLLAAAVPKAFGAFGQTWSDWVNKRRQIAAFKNDADSQEKDKQIAYLKGVNDEKPRLIEEFEHLIYQHLDWDYQRYSELVGLGKQPSPPPTLWPNVRTMSGMPQRKQEGSNGVLETE